MATRNGNGTNLGFEDKLWAAADKPRCNMDAAEYKHFLRSISDASIEKFTVLQGDKLTQGRVSRWQHILGAKRNSLGSLADSRSIRMIAT